MRRRLCFMTLLGFAAAPVSAATVFSDEGRSYMISCSNHGYILHTLDPVERVSGAGSKKTPFFFGEEVLYLGRDCDASNDYFGPGQWRWVDADGDNSFDIILTFKNKQISFPDAWLSCRGDTSDLGTATAKCRR